MAIVELGKKVEKDVFRLVTSVGQRKNSESPRGIESQIFGFQLIPRSDALSLSHRDSTVSEIYYEVHMTFVLHPARISNVINMTNKFSRKI